MSSLVFFLAAVLGCLYFPVGKTVLAVGVVCYAVISIRFPFFPLLFIPAFLPLVNLAPWSGIVLFEEFDLFLLATLGVSVCHSRTLGTYSYETENGNGFLRLNGGKDMEL